MLKLQILHMDLLFNVVRSWVARTNGMPIATATAAILTCPSDVFDISTIISYDRHNNAMQCIPQNKIFMYLRTSLPANKFTCDTCETCETSCYVCETSCYVCETSCYVCETSCHPCLKIVCEDPQ